MISVGRDSEKLLSSRAIRFERPQINSLRGPLPIQYRK